MSNKALVKQLLMSGNYWTLNKNVVKVFGIETAFLLSVFAEAEKMMGDNDGWFYQTSDTIEEITGLTRYKQDRCIDELEKSGVLIKDVRGIPAKRYFKFDYEVLTTKIVKNLQTGLKKTNKLDCKKPSTSKESINKESINKESIKEHRSVSDETDKIPYEEVVDYLNSVTGSKYRSSTKGTQRLISARWNEGFRVEDFKKVIDVKYEDWFHDSKMIDYLRPQTLFGTKFESYLNQSFMNNKTENGGEYDDLF